MASPGQVVEQSMLAGFQQGSAEKEAHKEEERQQQINDLLNQRDALQQKFSSTLDANGNWTDASRQINQDVLKNQASIREFYHPDKNPGAIAKYGRLLMERMHMVKPPQKPTSESITTQQKPVQLPPAPPTKTEAQPSYEETHQTAPAQKETTKPLNTSFNPEDQDPQVSLAFNKAWAKPGPYSTPLPHNEELEFRVWAAQNPKAVAGMVGPGPNFDPLPNSGYDARGWFHAMRTGDPSGKLKQVSTNFGTSMHGSDKFKTPYNGTFSNESQYATPDAPHWEGNGKLIAKDGRLVVNETPKNANATQAPQIATSTSTQPGVPAQTLTGIEGPGPTLPASAPVTVTGPAMTDKEREEFKKTGKLPAKLAGQQADAQAAASLEAAAPLSPEETAAQQRKIADADSQARVASMKETFHRLVPNPTPEQQTQFDDMVLQSVLGIKPTQQTGDWVYTEGHLADGTPLPLLYNKKDGTYKTRTGDDVPQEVLSQWTADAKPQKMSANDRLWDSYAASLGKTTNQLTMRDKSGFEEWLNKLKARTTTRQAVVYDRLGNAYTVDLSSFSSPSNSAPPAAPGASSPGGAQASPRSGAPPQAGASASAQPSHPGAGGQTTPHLIPGLKKGTPAWNKAFGDYVEDQRIADLSNSWINLPAGQRSEADYQFVVKLVHANAGRVNLPEIDAAFGAGGAALWLQKVLSKKIRGELPDPLRQQLFTLVHNQVDADKTTLQQIDNPDNTQAPAGDVQINAIVDGLKGLTPQQPAASGAH